MKKGMYLIEGFTKSIGLLILILLFVLFSIMMEFRKPSEFKISSNSENLDLEISMNNMMRTPVIIDDMYITYIDLIELYSFDSLYKHKLISATEEILLLMEHYFDVVIDGRDSRSCKSTYFVTIEGKEGNSLDIDSLEVLSYSIRGKTSSLLSLAAPDCYDVLKRNHHVSSKEIILQNGDKVIISLTQRLNRYEKK
jgi:hypothetical protein